MRLYKARLVLGTGFALSALSVIAWAPLRKQDTVAAIEPLRVLIVGGGPDLRHNQVAIESNVRYVGKLIKPDSNIRILFTDGNPRSKNVLCEDADHNRSYRAPELPRLDGPAELSYVHSELKTMAEKLKSDPQSSVLLYFTGHGGADEESNLNNNVFELWNRQELSVKDLAASIRSFPSSTPVTLVMVECFSGAFGNLLFEDGDPSNSLADRHLCGFFASVPQRMAAGCTPEVNEADYHDFTGYFFAALTGKDRLGRPVTGADYDHDGKVGMNEAFAYALLHDDSIDTPVCTSDVFLRKYVKTSDRQVFETPYADVRSWATPAQLAALDGLSQQLELNGQDRLGQAYDAFLHTNVQSFEPRDVKLIRLVRLAKTIVLAHNLKYVPDDKVKARFDELVKEEGSNPVRP